MIPSTGVVGVLFCVMAVCMRKGRAGGIPAGGWRLAGMTDVDGISFGQLSAVRENSVSNGSLMQMDLM